MIGAPWPLGTLVIALLQAEPNEAWTPGFSGAGLQTLFAIVIVSGVLALWVWLMRRGTFRGHGAGPVTIETAVPLGERRSLVIVSIEGRRLLLGLTPASVSLVTALDDPENTGFANALGRANDQESRVDA